ncbi:MAG: hypothetical protein RLZZ573_73, partial [Pseudomonadota bacterium]
MKITLKRLTLAIAGAGLLTIYGCGGGSSSSSTSTTPITLGGINATGAAFTDAVIKVVNSRGVTVGTSSVIGADGVFSITLSAGAVAPFVLTSSRTSAEGAIESLVSVVPAVTGSSATVNITPVTNLIASRLSSSGDPLKLATELAAGNSVVNATTVAATVADVQAILDPVLQATGTAGTNPLTGTFAADGTGYDRLLDSIKVSITVDSATTSNVEIGIKQQLPEGAAPNVIQFANGAAATPIATVQATVAALPSISGTLLPSGTSALIAAHLAQLTACYALPITSRVSGVFSGSAPNRKSVGGAANIIAPECKNVFMGNDPANFKSNGNLVGSSGAFGGLFKEGATGVVFSQGTYEFTRANVTVGPNTFADTVISYKSKDTSGNETFDTFALRLDPADNKLKQIGNQYNYSGGVSSYQQLRQFPTLNQSAFNYYSTGYSLSVNDVSGGAGVGGSIYDRVEVTTPKNNVLTLKPKVGLSILSLVKFPGNVGGTEVVTGTAFVRLNSEYADTSNSADPKLKDTTMFFGDRAVFTNTEIAKIPAQSVWKFAYFLAGNLTTTPDATQHYKTRARALTIPELKAQGLAELTSADILFVSSNANPSNVANPGKLPMAGFTSATVHYTVPTGALPPTSLKIYGQYGSGSFDDTLGVASTARTGDILCKNAGGSDAHCTGASYAATAVG